MQPLVENEETESSLANSANEEGPVFPFSNHPDLDALINTTSKPQGTFRPRTTIRVSSSGWILKSGRAGIGDLAIITEDR